MRIGILGGGVQAMFLGQGARSMQASVRTLDPNPASVAFVLSEGIVGGLDDMELLKQFCDDRDIVTIEGTYVPAASLLACSQFCPTGPGVRSLAAAQDRFALKQLCAKLSIPSSTALPAGSLEDVVNALATIGLPLVGRYVLQTDPEERSPEVLPKRDDVMTAWRSHPRTGAWLLEQYVLEEKEIVATVVRSSSGQVTSYPLTEVHRKEGFIHEIIAPAPGLPSVIVNGIATAAAALVDALDHTGVLTMHALVRGNHFSVEQLTPTVGTPGLWTLEGAKTNQYRNHLLAITGEQLEHGELMTPCRTVRLFGEVPPALSRLEMEGLGIHVYGIKDAHARTAVGHVTITGADRPDFSDRWKKLMEALGIRGS